MVVRHSAHGAALFGVLCEHHQPDHKDRRDDGGHDIEVVDKEAVAGGLKGEFVDPDVDALRQTDIERLDLGSPHQVTHAFEEIGQADGRHEQNDRLLPHKVAEHETLHAIGQHDHHDHR